MRKIPSFQIDHTRLKRGVFVSRKDTLAEETVTTFDLRMKEPNNEPVLTSACAHTIEHIGATFLRNHHVYSEKTIYFGPMGCLTGFYLLLKGDLDSLHIVSLMQELFGYIAEYTGAIPGATPVECGNYLLMDLADARREAQKYCEEILADMQKSNLVYPEVSV
jgi:S-ribosylhomocysteine lyase